MVAQKRLESFLLVVNIFLSGTASSAASKYICGANLIALNQDSGTIHLIAVGVIIRRIVSKNVCSSVLSDARELLVPHHVRVGVPVARESVNHSVRDFIGANDHKDDMAMLKINFKNAFNLVDRQTLATKAYLTMIASRNKVLAAFNKVTLLVHYFLR